MSSTEIFELTFALKVVLWVEAIVYLGIGIFEIFLFCLGLNIWGLIVYFLNTRKNIIPFTYKRFHDDVVEAGIPESRIKAMDKMAGYKDT